MESEDIEMKIQTDKSEKEMSLCEQRIISDISEFKRSKLVGTICQIKLNEYKKNNKGEFELIIEFISYFSIKFIFNLGYPLSPPTLIYNDGLKIKNIFDENGGVLVETIKKENWNKSIWLSTLIFYIELLISKECIEKKNLSNDLNQNNIKDKNEKYGKRKWKDYVNEINEKCMNDNLIQIELEKNLKQLKAL